jgi:Protein of unknown function (DUF3891)
LYTDIPSSINFMIVNPTQKGWQVIYHRAHALLAAAIAGQWRMSTMHRLSESWLEISLAHGHKELAIGGKLSVFRH